MNATPHLSADALSHTMQAIEANNLSKYYRVYLRPVDRLKEAILRKPYHQRVEALTDVSFRMQAGETLGIIGENGAGKSTLLKLLARTVKPSTGELTIQGRVAALLELGTGFHPEFSGRENIHLNAALLGLTEKEIREREADIIAFSELEEVIERPIKTYSSGMTMRLAFSIATSVDPDILIVDEALSVGDQRFQKRCVDRMMAFKKSGKTFVVCSHSLYLINELCGRCMWIADGKIQSLGETARVIADYQSYMQGRKNGEKQEKVLTHQSQALPEVMIQSLTIHGKNGSATRGLKQFQSVEFQVKTRCLGEPIQGHVGIGIVREDGELVFGTATHRCGLEPLSYAGDQVIRLSVPSMVIIGKGFRAKAVIADTYGLRVIHEFITPPFDIEGENPDFGLLWMDHRWNVEAVPHAPAAHPKS